MRRLAEGTHNATQTSNENETFTEAVFTNVLVQQEIFIDVEIDIVSSVSGLTNSYELQYLLRRQIERKTLVYIETEAGDGSKKD